MTSTIVSRKPLAAALAAFRRAYVGLMTDAARRIAGEVVSHAGDDGIVQPREAERIIAAASSIVRGLFVDSEGRAVAPDGTPLSPYARLLLTACAWVTQAQVRKQGAWMRAAIPDDVQRWMRSLPRPVREMAGVRRVELRIIGEQTDDGAGRIGRRNPLAQYDAPHTWVDPNGYTLSERIWRADTETRARLNALLREQIANGNSATNIARKLEQFLVPGRAALRTDKPYGTDGSYYTMRLARTEIASANNRAALAAAWMNPYVTHIEWKRSGNGDPNCPICPRFVGRYTLANAPTPPAHPHCRCYTISIVSRSPDDVADELRAMMRDGATPAVTPMDDAAFARQLLGLALAGLLAQASRLLDL